MADEFDEKKIKRREEVKTPSRKVSVWRQTHQTPIGVVENTYQLQPPKLFKVDQATPIIQSALNEELHGEEYSSTNTRQMAKRLAQKIKARMMFLSFKRYKIVVHVAIGQMSLNPGVFIASRCLWNAEFDNYASAAYESTKLFATAVVYFLNFE